MVACTPTNDYGTSCLKATLQTSSGRCWVSDTAFAFLTGLAISVSSATAAEFRAGAAAVDITPTNLPIRTAGNLTLTLVNKIHDPLHSRALVLDDGATRLVIAVVDSCMISREDLDEAKSAAARVTGVPVEHVLISSTHTHTAPAVYGCHGNDAEPAYRAWLIPRITESIVQAWRNLRSARVGWGKSELPTFVHCRRWVMQPGAAIHPNPAFTGQPTNLVMMNPGHANPNKVRQTGPVDPAVTVLSLQTPEGKPLALLANYSTHYANAPSREISADYFGEFCNVIAKELKANELNPGFVALMSNGTSGDANCSDFMKTNWVVNPVIVAKAVAAAAMQALAAVKYHDWVPLAAVEKRVTFNVRLPTKEQIAEAREFLATEVGDRPTRTWEENYARETTLMSDWPATKELKLQAFRIGDFGIDGIPCETYGSTGLAIKKGSPFAVTMVIGLANGYHGYLPPPDQFPLGGYTTWRARTSYLEMGAEPKIVKTVIELMNQANQQRRDR
jgi:neutral ceramidase